MNWFVFHVASGQSFFTGIALVVVAALASRSGKPIAARFTVLAFVIGLISIVVSSTPLPYWFYGIAALVTVLWIVSAYVTKWRQFTALAVVVVWTIAAGLELPFHLSPKVSPPKEHSITIIGDSVTAGMGGEDKAETWPAILEREQDVKIRDFSHVGETAASALKRLSDHQVDSPLVIVEIGGNDLLGSTSAQQFAHDLDAMLSHLTSPGRQILMFELPLPPLSHEYGRIQRLLASKYNARMIPKWMFMKILAMSDSTLDSIHLSQAGHRAMADRVWKIIGPAFLAASGQ